MSTTQRDAEREVPPNGISVEELRSRLQSRILSAIRDQRNMVIQAPTGSGKSHITATTQWTDYPDITGEGTVLHLSPTRAARDESAQKSREAGVNYAVIEGRQDSCSVASGKHDHELPKIEGMAVSDWIDTACNIGHIGFSQVHRRLEDEFDDLPCCVNGDCNSISKLREVIDGKDDSDYDVIHATASFAHIPDLVDGSNVIFDELPQFRIDFDQETIRRVATTEVQQRSDGNLRWEGLLEAVQCQNEVILGEYRKVLGEPHSMNVDWENETIDVLAPQIVRAVCRAKPVGEEQLVGRSDRVRVVLNERNTVEAVYHLPDLSTARAVIGLDAHPSPLRWTLETGLSMSEDRLLTPNEARDWRKYGRGLRTIQVSRYTESLTRGWRSRTQQERVTALIHEITETHGSEFRTCVCPKSVKEDIQSIMEDAGVESPEILTYGDLKSRNTFSEESVGLVIGCIDPGDHNVLSMLGLLALEAYPEYYENDDGEKKRKHGRGFTGPDKKAAEELLESVRKMNVAQGVGRYARNPTDSDKSALVYVWTTAVPETLIDEKAPGVIELLTDNDRAVLKLLRSVDGPVTAKQVCEEIEITKPTALDILNGFVNKGLAGVSAGTGPYGANEYEPLSGDLRPEVDLNPITE